MPKAIIASTWLRRHELTNAAAWYYRLWKPVSDWFAGWFGDAGWTTVSTFSNSWGSTGGSFPPVQYRYSQRLLFMRGALTGGVAGPTTGVAFQVPALYVPTITPAYFACRCASGVARVDVDASGNVIVVEIEAGTATDIDLSAIVFPED